MNPTLKKILKSVLIPTLGIYLVGCSPDYSHLVKSDKTTYYGIGAVRELIIKADLVDNRVLGDGSLKIIDIFGRYDDGFGSVDTVYLIPEKDTAEILIPQHSEYFKVAERWYNLLNKSRY